SSMASVPLARPQHHAVPHQAAKAASKDSTSGPKANQPLVMTRFAAVSSSSEIDWLCKRRSLILLYVTSGIHMVIVKHSLLEKPVLSQKSSLTIPYTLARPHHA